MDSKPNKKLEVAFVWHMHQPYYKDEASQIYTMPWVRLHGVKDYYPMASFLERFDNVQVTFNFTPVLVEQIDDYVRNGASDVLLDLTLKRASDLSTEEKVQILNSFFRVNYKRFIEPNRRYRQLWVKRGFEKRPAVGAEEVLGFFSDRDILDLQVLFNLSWFHSAALEEDANLQELAGKAEGYSEEDKAYIVRKQSEILSRIIPLYKRLQDSDRIEITTSPYYHPILPLLCDTDVARVSAPDTKLPAQRFSHPEDAEWHIIRALRYHTEQFGRAARGVWPSEEGVSDESLRLLMRAGIGWTLTDEDILFNTLGSQGRTHPDRRMIYRPYRYKSSAEGIDIIFRDKNLSNLISFSYHTWDQKAAAEDLLGHFGRIRRHLDRHTKSALLTIAMDGENAWEYYEDNGRKFFEVVYSGLDSGHPIGTTTVSDYLESDPPKRMLEKIYPGSWINHNFDTWIGQRQKNLAWEYLYKARNDLLRTARHRRFKDKAIGQEALRKAWREIYIAEGSDWNWWYGSSPEETDESRFDGLFRAHLKNVYRLLDSPVPDYLKKSIA